MIHIVSKVLTAILFFLLCVIYNESSYATSFDFGEEFWQDAAKIGITSKDPEFNDTQKKVKEDPAEKLTAASKDNIFTFKKEDKHEFMSKQKNDGTVAPLTRMPNRNLTNVQSKVLEPPMPSKPEEKVRVDSGQPPLPIIQQQKVESPMPSKPEGNVKVDSGQPPLPAIQQQKVEQPMPSKPEEKVRVDSGQPPLPTIQQQKVEQPMPPKPSKPEDHVRIDHAPSISESQGRVGASHVINETERVSIDKSRDDEHDIVPAKSINVYNDPISLVHGDSSLDHDSSSLNKNQINEKQNAKNVKVMQKSKKQISIHNKGTKARKQSKKIFSKEDDSQQNKKDQVPFFASYDSLVENALDPKKLEKRRKVYDYRNVILPPSISKEFYSDQNQHLPKAFYMSEYSQLLYIAVENQNIGAIKTLLLRGANINSQDLKNGYTPLMYAVKTNKKLSVRYLIVKGVNMNTRAFDGKTALHIAAITGNFEILKILVSNKANLFIRDDDGKTFFDYLDATNKDLILYFFSNYDDVNQVLIDSTILGSLDGIKYALNRGADINFKSYLNGDTALIIAARYSYVDIAMFLLENGADYQVQNLYGDNALNIALMQNDIKVASLIETLIFNQELAELGLVNSIFKNKKIPIRKVTDKKVKQNKTKDSYKEDFKNIEKANSHEHHYSFYDFDLYPSQRFLNSKNKLYLFTEK